MSDRYRRGRGAAVRATVVAAVAGLVLPIGLAEGASDPGGDEPADVAAVDAGVEAAGVAAAPEASDRLVEGGGAEVFVSLDPERFANSVNTKTFDGQFANTGPVAGGTFWKIQIADRGGVPATAQAAIMNVTATGASSNGNVRVYPCTAEVPTVSALNFTPGSTEANEVIAKLSATGHVCVYASSTVHVLVDVVGYVDDGSPYTPIDPARYANSKNTKTFDGEFANIGPIAGGTFWKIQIADRGDIPASATTVVANVTVTGPTGNGNLRVYPCTAEVPGASALNYTPGLTRPNELVAKLSPTGHLCIWTKATAHILVDAVGYIGDTPGYTPVDPTRYAHSANTTTFDGQYANTGPVDAGTFWKIQIAGRGIVPADATTVVANVTVTGPQGNGNVRVYPCTADIPGASSLNYTPGMTRPNELVAKLSATGHLCAWTKATTNLIIDVVGHNGGGGTKAPIEQFTRTPGWHLEPSDVMFTGSGQSETVQLVHYGLDGLPSGLEPPASATLVRSGTDFTVGPYAAGEIPVSGSSFIGSEYVRVEADGIDALTFTVSSVRLKPGVGVIDAADLVVPGPDDIELTSLEPFTDAEFLARTNAEFDRPYFPHVLRGTPPTVGDLVAIEGGMFGRVIEPPGASTIVRDGLALITIEVPPLDEVFAEIDVDVDFEALADSGVLPPLEQTVCIEFEDPDCDLVIPLVESFDRLTEATGGDFEGCEASAAFKTGENKIKFDMTVTNLGELLAVTSGGSLQTIQIVVGLGVGGSVSLEGKLQATLGAEFECKVAELDRIEFALPAPLGAILNGTIRPSNGFKVEFEVGGGPKLEYGAGCQASVAVAGGLRYSRGVGLSALNRSKAPSVECEGKFEFDGGLPAGLGPSLTAEVKPWAYLRGTAGVRVGGKWMEALGDWLREPDLGVFEPFEVKAGPRADMATENFAATISGEKSGTQVLARIVGSAGLNEDAVDGILTMLANRPVDIGLPEFEVGFTVGRPVVKARDAGTPLITVNGEGATTVSIDDVVVVTFDVPEPDPVPFLGSTLEDNALVVREVGSGFEESTDFAVAASGSEFTLTTTVDAQLCNLWGKDGANYRVATVASILGGLVKFPTYVGKVTLKCDQTLEVVPEEATMTKRRPTKEFDLEQKGYDGVTFGFSTTDTLPDGVTVTFAPPSGPLVEEVEGEKRNEVQATLNCGDYDETTSATYIVTVDGAPSGPVILLDLNCSDDYFDIVEDEVIGGEPVTFDTSGELDDLWTGGFTPSEGFLRGRESTSDEPEVLTAISPPDNRPQEPIPPGGCAGGVAGLKPLPEERFAVGASTTHRGGDTVIVIWEARDGKPAKPGQPCPPPPPDPPGGPGGSGGNGGSGGGGAGTATGGAWGDPHMTTFDGKRYDSQTVGEYIYAAPLPGEPDGPVVIARHEFTSAESAFRPTSATAIAIVFEGHVIELYARPSEEVRVDGTPIDFGPAGDRTFIVGSGLLRRDYGTYVFEHPKLGVTASLLYTAINVNVSVAADQTYGGLLGIADGSVANDLVVRDLGQPITSWTTYPDAAQFSDEAVIVAESWRLTDIADSPFTIPSDSFDDESPLGLGSELLEPFRLLALQRLEAASAMCSGVTTPGARDIEIFAIELAIGNDPILPGCQYQVTGRVVTDGGAPAAGVEVTIDGPGLEVCQTTTLIDGGFRCLTGVDVDGLDDPGAAMPLVVDVFAAPPGAAVPAGSTTVTFTTPAPFGGAVSEHAGDVVIPAASTTQLDLTGTLTSLGAPVDSATAFRLQADDTSGTPVIDRLVNIAPDVNGDYAYGLGLPLDTGDVTLTWQIGLPGDPQPSALFDDLVPGTNPKVFDADYDPIELIIDGTMTYNGVAPDPTTITVLTERGDGSVYNFLVTATPAGDGSYQTSTYLPIDVAEVTLEATLGAGPVVSTPFVVPAAPTMPVVFDVIVDAPVIDVSGVVDDNGAVPAEFYMRIEADTASGPYGVLERVFPDPVTGAYAFSELLPSNATAVTLIAQIGTVPADNPESGLIPVVPGANPIVFDPAVAAPTLALSGVSSGGGVPDPGAFVVRVQTGTFSTLRVVHPDATGAWSTDFELPVGTTSADVIAETGYSAVDYTTVTASGLVPGPNPVVVDSDYPATVLQMSGNLSLDGVPREGQNRLSITAFDATDTIVTTRSPYVDATAGAYTETVFLPASVTKIQASARLGQWPLRRPFQTFDSLVPGANPIVFDDHAVDTVLDISGIFTSGSSYIAGPFDLEITSTLVEPDGSESSFVQRVTPTASYADGTYDVQVTVPEIARASTLVAELGTFPVSYPTLAVDPLAAGVNTIDFSGAVDLSVYIDVVAVITDAGEPVTTPTELRYVTRDESSGVVDDSTVIVIPDATGYVEFQIEALNVVRSIDLARVVGLPGEPDDFTTFSSLVPGPNLVVYAADYDPPIAELSGVATRNGDPIASIDVTWDVTDGALGAQTYTDTLTPDGVTGAFDVTRTFAQGTTTVEVTIDSGDPLDGVAAATEPLTDGANPIALDLVVVRPDVTLSGVATRNGDPIASIDVTWDVTDGLDAPATYTDTVTPDPVTGAYSVDRLFAAGTTTVDITLDSGDAGDPMPTSTEALVDGANALALDLVSARPEVDLSGIVTVGGLPAAGPVQFDFTVRGSQPDETFSLDVNPDAGDASYAVTLPLLPHWATDLDVTARVISSRPETWESTTFSGLVPGTNTLTFDAISDVQVFNITGNITADGDPLNRQIFMRIFTWDDTGGIIDSPQFEITPDAAGDFSFDYIPPDLADEVRIDVKLYTAGGGAGATVSHTFTPLLPGANALDVDTDFDYHIVDFDGLITIDGVPIDSPLTLQIEAYDNLAGTGSPVLATVSTNDPDAPGTYVSDFENLPSDIVRVDVGLSLVGGNLLNDEIWQTFEVTSGVSRFSFSEDYVPLMLNLSGTMTHDGVPITDDVLVDIEWRQTFPGGGVFPQSRLHTFSPDVNGDYTISLQGPRNADHVTVTFRYGVTLQDFQTTVIDPIAPGDNDHVVDLVYVGNYLDISGVIEYLGAPLVGTESFRIYSYDAAVGGSYLGQRFLTVDPDDVTGAYSELAVQIPSASVQTWVEVQLGGPFDTYETFRTTVDAAPGATTPVVLNAQTTSIDLSGTVTVDGSLHTDETFTLTIAAYDGATELDADVLGGDGEITTDASGDYTLQVFLPLDTDRIVVTPTLGDAPSTEITSLTSPGVNTATVDITSTSAAGNVTLSGTITGGGEPVYIDVIAWEFDEGAFFPEAIQLGVDSAVVTWDELSGDYTATASVPLGTEYIELRVNLTDEPFAEYMQTFDVQSDVAPYALSYSLEHTGTWIDVSGYAYFENIDGLCLEAGVTSFTFEGYSHDGPLTGSTPVLEINTPVLLEAYDIGGIPLDGYFEFAYPVPDGSVAASTTQYLDDFYPPFLVGAFTGYGIEPLTPGGNFFDVTFDESDYYCAF